MIKGREERKRKTQTNLLVRRGRGEDLSTRSELDSIDGALCGECFDVPRVGDEKEDEDERESKECCLQMVLTSCPLRSIVGELSADVLCTPCGRCGRKRQRRSRQTLERRREGDKERRSKEKEKERKRGSQTAGMRAFDSLELEACETTISFFSWCNTSAMMLLLFELLFSCCRSSTNTTKQKEGQKL